jgi:hypothetical protein
MTPFEVVYGKPTPSIISYLPSLSKVQELDKTLITHVEILCTLEDNLVLAKNCMN